MHGLSNTPTEPLQPKISKSEAAAYVTDILTGKLTPQQYKKSKEWYLDLGSIAVESSDGFADYTTEELARLAKEALEDFVVEDESPELIDPPRFSRREFFCCSLDDGCGFRFMSDCRAKGMNYREACTAIHADSTTAGEW